MGSSRKVKRSTRKKKPPKSKTVAVNEAAEAEFLADFALDSVPLPPALARKQARAPEAYRLLCRGVGRKPNTDVIKGLERNVFHLDLGKVKSAWEEDSLDTMMTVIQRFPHFSVVTIVDSTQDPDQKRRKPARGSSSRRSRRANHTDVLEREREENSTLNQQRAKTGARIFKALGSCLSKTKTLKHLEVRGISCSGSIAKLCHGLRKCVSLERLFFGNCEIGDRRLTEILHALGASGINQLQFRRCGLTPRAGADIRRFIQVQCARRDELQWCAGLRQCGFDAQRLGLTSLDLSHNTLRSSGVSEIARAVTHDSWLLSIDFSANEVDDEGCFALVDALQENTSLLQIDLRNNPDISETGLEHVAQALTRKKSKRKKTPSRLRSSGVLSRLPAHRTPPAHIQKLIIPFDSLASGGAQSVSSAEPADSGVGAKRRRAKLKRDNFLAQPASINGNAQSQIGNDAMDEVVGRVMMELQEHESARQLAEQRADDLFHQNSVLRDQLRQARAANSQTGNGLSERDGAQLLRLISYLETSFRRLHVYMDALESHSSELDIDGDDMDHLQEISTELHDHSEMAQRLAGDIRHRVETAATQDDLHMEDF